MVDILKFTNREPTSSPTTSDFGSNDNELIFLVRSQSNVSNLSVRFINESYKNRLKNESFPDGTLIVCNNV